MINEFLEYLENNKAGNTMRSAQSPLNAWFPDGRMDLTFPYISERFNQLRNSKMSVGYLRLHLDILYSLAKYVNERTPVPDFNEIAKICKSIRAMRQIHTLPKDEDILALNKSLRNRKYAIILSLMANCGMRVSEIVNLNIGDVESNRILIKNSNQKSRYIMLPNMVSKEIQIYIQVYHHNSKNNDKPLFYGKQKENRLLSNSIQQVIANHCKELEITFITGDRLRYSIAKHITAGIDFDEGKKYLNQNSKISEGKPYLPLT